jgi:hypothetical protein
VRDVNITEEDTTANVSIIYTRTGSSQQNVSLNGVFLGKIGAGTSARFDGKQAITMQGMNTINFTRIAGGGADVHTITLVQINTTRSSYTFTFPSILGEGDYQYYMVVESDSITNTSGVRNLNVLPAPAFQLNRCPNLELTDVILFGVIGAFLMALVFIALATRIPIIGILSGIGMIFYGITLFNCQSAIGVIVVSAGFFVMTASLLIGLGCKHC